MNTKRVLAGILSLAMVASVAGCGSSETTTTTTKAATPDAGNAGTTTTTAAGTTAAPSGEKIKITFSWWGGDARHEATQQAIAKYEELNPNIDIVEQFGAWSGWEDAMSTQFYAGTAPDINQVNWNWLTSYSSDGKVFADMNAYADYFDLTQYDQAALDQCTVAGKLQAIPVSMTGRIFYWNTKTFEAAGIAVPTSLAELKAAGEKFKTVLGDDYYPLACGEYDRMILMVHYLESKYNKAWVVDNKLNYTEAEIAEGLQFLSDLEAAHVMPTIATIDGDGADSLDKNPKWIEGKYAGIFEWDSSASKFSKALADNSGFVVGDYFADMGDAKGGFSKVSLGFAISETAANKEECAKFLNFLLNEDEGTAIMSSQRGIPLSKAALANCVNNDLLDKQVTEANGKVLAWVSFGLDPKFEDSALKGDPDGVYYDALSGLSYGDYDVAKAAKVMYEGISEVLAD